MQIRVEKNAAYIKQQCLVCGVWDRPGDVAFFTENNEWVCDRCVGEGVSRIRLGLLEHAAALRREAAALENAAQEEITLPDESEVRAAREEVERYWREYVTGDSPGTAVIIDQGEDTSNVRRLTPRQEEETE
jgi:hypothetical protein